MIYQHQNYIHYYTIKKFNVRIDFELYGVLNLFHQNNICINPKYITINFEQIAINANKLVFPNAIPKACNFLFNKNVFIQNYRVFPDK